MKTVVALFVLLVSTRIAFAQFNIVQQSDGLYYARVDNTNSTTSAYNVVFIGDGYTAAEMASFDAAVDVCINEKVTSDGLLVIEPYASAKCRFRFWRVELVSNVSGIGGSSPLGCTFGAAGQPYMKISGDPVKIQTAVEQAGLTGWDYIVVITNTPTRYGAYYPFGGQILYLSSGNAWGIYVAHELGHAIASLGDEYECDLCYPDNPDEGRTLPPGTVLDEPNLSTDLDNIKWKNLIPQWVFDSNMIPTVPEHTCDCEVIGAWEGGGYYSHGVYRSQEYCAMDAIMCTGGDGFCAACRDALQAMLPECGLWVVSTHLKQYRRVWELPPCLVCEPSGTNPEEIRREMEFDTIVMKFLHHGPPEWPELPKPQITVRDDWAELVAAETRITGDVIEVTFQANRIRRYSIEFENEFEVSPDREIGVEFYRNGVREELFGR
jgi:hypothetical protein